MSKAVNKFLWLHVEIEMEIIVLGLCGSIGAVLSQLFEFINRWRSATHRPLLHPYRPEFQANTVLSAEPQAVALRQRLRRSV